jgi:hypothetical protein
LKAILDDWPMKRPAGWLRFVNEPMTKKEVEGVRTCLERNRPYAQQLPQPNERPHDLNVDFNRLRAAQGAGEHGYALLGEGMGQILAMPFACAV